MSKQLIKKYNILAKKSLGQNFLIDTEKVQDIANIIKVTNANIIEVWPWYWALTELLLHQNPESLYLVELDQDMIEIIHKRQEVGELQTQNIDFQIFHQDVLTFSPDFERYSVIANIPYYITSPILYHFLYEVQKLPENMVILMQKDVADKIIGGKKKKSSVLSLMTQKKCYVKEKLFVPKESFSPIPKVESSVLLFQTHDLYTEVADQDFLEIIKIWFSEPRKKLINNFKKSIYDLSIIEKFICLQWYDLNFRGEDGDISFWIRLVKELIVDNDKITLK